MKFTKKYQSQDYKTIAVKFRTKLSHRIVGSLVYYESHRCRWIPIANGIPQIGV